MERAAERATAVKISGASSVAFASRGWTGPALPEERQGHGIRTLKAGVILHITACGTTHYSRELIHADTT
jgi:hypothetical protein